MWCVCCSEHNDGWAKNSSRRTATGKRLPTATEGYHLQRKDKGINGEIHTGNGITEDQESGMYNFS